MMLQTNLYSFRKSDLFLVDRLWFGRITGNQVPLNGLGEELIVDRDELKQQLLKQVPYPPGFAP